MGQEQEPQIRIQFVTLRGQRRADTDAAAEPCHQTATVLATLYWNGGLCFRCYTYRFFFAGILSGVLSEQSLRGILY